MNDPLLILDTSHPCLQLGLWVAGAWRYRSQCDVDEPRTASAILFPCLEQAFQILPLAELASLIVVVGPGSFTGLRTGVTVAQTLGQFMLGLSIYPVTNFQIAAPLGHRSHIYLRALRHQAYWGQVDEQGALIQCAMVDLKMVNGVERNTWVDKMIEEPYRPDVWQTPDLNWIVDDEETFLDKVLARRHGLVQQPWSAIQPLYLQAPRITRKNTHPPRGS